MGFDYGGIVGLIILALDIWAIIQVIQGRGPTEKKILWIVLILGPACDRPLRGC